MGPKKKEEDPEVILKRKFKIKCRFRALCRLVIANAYWMIADTDEYEGVDDVQRRVQQAVRSKKSKPELLKINDKALLNKPAADRTVTEKHYIYRIIGGLKCFKRYPVAVKRKLTAVTYFKYYGPNRVIVRQHHEGHALYFIVSGSVTVSQKVWDELLQLWQPVVICVLQAGDMFGEVSLLQDIPRTATCTTNTHCEFLQVLREDFSSVIQFTIQKQWDEVRRAMYKFSYFRILDEVSIREGCMIAKLKTYETDEIMLGDDFGIPNFVYFILSGRCQMIESLQMIVTKHLGRTSFKLHDPYVSKEESELDLDAKYFSAYNKGGEASKSDTTLRKSFNAEKFLKKPSLDSDFSQITYVSRMLDPEIIPEIAKENQNIKTIFMQVCQFREGASFGFGENMRDRRIVAETPVSCLLLPHVWLLQKNVANIWTRIQHFMEKAIPSKQQLFKDFVSEYRWKEKCDDAVKEVVARFDRRYNCTSIHDVPYSIRMDEFYEI